MKNKNSTTINLLIIKILCSIFNIACIIEFLMVLEYGKTPPKLFLQSPFSLLFLLGYLFFVYVSWYDKNYDEKNNYVGNDGENRVELKKTIIFVIIFHIPSLLLKMFWWMMRGIGY